jgi:hypothetical protein
MFLFRFNPRNSLGVQGLPLLTPLLYLGTQVGWRLQNGSEEDPR